MMIYENWTIIFSMGQEFTLETVTFATDDVGLGVPL